MQALDIIFWLQAERILQMKPVMPVLEKSISPLETQFAKHQEEYRTLPALVGEGGLVTSRWKLTWVERFVVLFGGSIWLQQITFGKPLQPVQIVTKEPNLHECGL